MELEYELIEPKLSHEGWYGECSEEREEYGC